MTLDPAALAAAVHGVDGAISLALRVQPGAKRSQVKGMHGDRLRVAIAAPPVDGKANRALIAWLAKLLGVRKDAVVLIAGASSRDKRFRCEISRAELERALLSEA